MITSSYKNYFGVAASLSSGASNFLTQKSSGLTIYGTFLNDILKDNFGGNTLIGGRGDDTYHIVDSRTVVSELAGGGIDTVLTWSSYRLPTNVEVLTLGSPNLTGWANDAGSLVIADGERATLVSGKGADILVDSGAGGNNFAFSQGGGMDVIYGFKAGGGYNHDAIQLRDYGFTSFSQITPLLSQVGADTKLSLPTGDVVLIRNVQVSTLTADNFRLQLDTSKLALTFADEFKNVSLYDDKTGKGVWETTYTAGPENGAGSIYARTSLNNGEKQVYVDPLTLGLGATPVGINPFSVSDGVLSITASKTPDSVKSQLYGYDYTSGLLTTEKTFAQTYGYFEIRAQMPDSSGMFPAFWLMREDKIWPPELDVFENVGGDMVFQGFATKDVDADKRSTVSTVENVSSGFHTYGLLWTADTITWYVDGVATGSVPTPSDMHSPMYLLVNLAVGGHWAGNPDANFVSDALKVDYIRAYALDAVSTSPIASAANLATDLVIPNNSEAPAVHVARGAGDMELGGADAVQSAYHYTLPGAAHDLTLTGSTAINGVGNALNNHLVGNVAANILTGLSGDDILEGGDGDDHLSGGYGADHLLGGTGADILDGGYDNDILTGGAGADVFLFSQRSGVDTVTDFGANGNDRLDVKAWLSAGYKASVYMVGADTYVADGHGAVIILTGVHSSHLQATATGFDFV